MDAKFYILYKNGKEDVINLKGVDKTELEGIFEVINTCFTEGVNGVVRLNDERQANFIKLSEVARIKIE